MTNEANKTNRIDNIEWTGFSRLPDTKPVKEPKYYLQIFSTDDAYEQDIYFVNNTDDVIPLMIDDFLDNENEYKAAMQGVYSSKIKEEWVYRDIQPKQGVKIGSQHIIYHSDGLGQQMSSVFENEHTVWKFNLVVKGLFGSTVFLWANDEIPKAMITGTKKLILDDKPVDMDKVDKSQISNPIRDDVKQGKRDFPSLQNYIAEEVKATNHGDYVTRESMIAHQLATEYTDNWETAYELYKANVGTTDVSNLEVKYIKSHFETIISQRKGK